MPRPSVTQIAPRFQLRYWLAVLFFGLSALYFLRCAIWGTKGWLALKNRENDLSYLQVKLANKKKENSLLEVRIAKMNPQSLDLDFVEERARASLEFSLPNDIVLLDAGPETENLRANYRKERGKDNE